MVILACVWASMFGLMRTATGAVFFNRAATRLIRASNGYVVWSETYDRPFHDILMVQDDIAGEVTKALKASIEARPDHHVQSP